MQNHKKQENISVNVINEAKEVKSVSQGPVGNASQDPFCVYDHKRHAVGSKIINRNGNESVCSSEGSWKSN